MKTFGWLISDEHLASIKGPYGDMKTQGVDDTNGSDTKDLDSDGPMHIKIEVLN